MLRPAVRFTQAFISVFLTLAVLTASLRNLTTDGADHSASALLEVALGDALVLFIALGVVWVIPNRIWRAAPAADLTSPSMVTNGSEDAATGEVVLESAKPRPSENRVAKADGISADVEKRLLLVLLPTLLILAVGLVIYFLR